MGPGEAPIQPTLEGDQNLYAETEKPAGDDGEPSSDAADLETPTHRGDILAATLCLGFGLIGYFVLVPTAIYVPAQFAGTVNSPAFLSKVLFVILAVLSAIYLVQSVSAWRQNEPQKRTRLTDWGLAAGTALICVGYVAAMYIVGMTVASAACVAALIYYFGERRPWVIALVSLILPAFLWIFFVKIAHIFFPVPAIQIFEVFASTGSPDGAQGLITVILDHQSFSG